MTDPRALADSDSSPVVKALTDDRDGNVFIRMIMIDDQHRLGNDDIALYVDSVLGRNDAPIAYVAIVINHNDGFTCWILGGDIEPGILSQAHRIAKTNPNRSLSVNGARKVEGEAGAFGCEWIGPTNPETIKFTEYPWEELQRIWHRAAFRVMHSLLLCNKRLSQCHVVRIWCTGL